MLDNLSHENSSLKLEVDIYHRKVAKLQKVSIKKIFECYLELRLFFFGLIVKINVYSKMLEI